MNREIRLALVCALACAGIGGQATAAGQAGGQTSAPPERTVFEKQNIDQMSSAFTKPTVLKLNAIVARSKAVIDSYDAMIAGTRATVAVSAKNHDAVGKGRAALAALTTLSVKANAALADMRAAEAHLKASREPYNADILQGMVDFVTTVATEIATSRRQLSSKLANR